MRPEKLWTIVVVLGPKSETMLQANRIRDDREKVLAGLRKRNLKDAESLVDAAINIDKERRRKQVLRDEASAELNTLSSRIGGLMKDGKKAEADQLRADISGSQGARSVVVDCRLELDDCVHLKTLLKKYAIRSRRLGRVMRSSAAWRSARWRWMVWR